MEQIDQLGTKFALTILELESAETPATTGSTADTAETSD